MKDISFKVGRIHHFLTGHCIITSKGCEMEPPSIRVVEITVFGKKPDGKGFGLTNEFSSYDIDLDNFKDFIGHIKYKLREIFEKAETREDLVKAYNERFVKNHFHNCYIVDIK